MGSRLDLFSIDGSHFAWPSAAATGAVGVLGTGVAFVLMGRLVGRVGSTRASIVGYLIPVVALLLGCSSGTMWSASPRSGAWRWSSSAPT